jgi:hypothetical protein
LGCSLQNEGNEMDTKAHFIVFLTIVLVSCAPVSTPLPTSTATDIPQPTTTFTPEPTSTPIVSTLIGVLFFDLNANGLRDKASFVLALDLDGNLPFIAQQLFPEITGKNGDIISVDEPYLNGFKLCVVVSENQYCGTTNSDGKYTINNIPVASDTKVTLKITDPHASDIRLAMRYVNRLVNAKPTLSTLNNGVILSTGENAEIGLIMGFLTSWYSSSLDFKPIILTYTDLNLTIGQRLDWLGNTKRERIGNQSVWNDVSYGVYDQHQGFDTVMPIGTEILAMSDGPVLISAGGTSAEPFARYVRQVINISGDPFVYLVTYGHNSVNKVNAGSSPQRGLAVALSGNNAGTQTTNPHVHISIYQVPRKIWNKYQALPELYDYIFGTGKFAGNGNAVRYVQGYDVAKDYCPFQNYLFTFGQIPVFPK